MSDWWVSRGTGDPVGPVPTDVLIRGIQSGRVPEDALVCRVGDRQWARLSEVDELWEVLHPENSTTNVINRPWFLSQDGSAAAAQPIHDSTDGEDETRIFSAGSVQPPAPSMGAKSPRQSLPSDATQIFKPPAGVQAVQGLSPARGGTGPATASNANEAAPGIPVLGPPPAAKSALAQSAHAQANAPEAKSAAAPRNEIPGLARAPAPRPAVPTAGRSGSHSGAATPLAQIALNRVPAAAAALPSFKTPLPSPPTAQTARAVVSPNATAVAHPATAPAKAHTPPPPQRHGPKTPSVVLEEPGDEAITVLTNRSSLATAVRAPERSNELLDEDDGTSDPEASGSPSDRPVLPTPRPAAGRPATRSSAPTKPPTAPVLIPAAGPVPSIVVDGGHPRRQDETQPAARVLRPPGTIQVSVSTLIVGALCLVLVVLLIVLLTR